MAIPLTLDKKQKLCFFKNQHFTVEYKDETLLRPRFGQSSGLVGILQAPKGGKRRNVHKD